MRHRPFAWHRWAATLALLAAAGGLDAWAQGQPPQGRPGADASARARRSEDEAANAAQWLQDAFAGQPATEAAEMLIAIARGSQLGPGEGWFHPGQSRFGWKWLAEKHGVPPTAAIPRAQFRGPEALFARLDRNKDGLLRPDDFDWSDRSPYAQQVAQINRWFFRLNRGGDGRLTREEWLKFFDEAAGGKDHLTTDNLREALTPPSSPGRKAPAGPTQQVLVRGLFRGEIGSMHEGPKLNDPAPDFTLRRRDGQEAVRLSDHFGKKPVVLVFGNFTCGPFRWLYPRVEDLARRYKDDALFLAVYVREAHPTDGWRMESNDAAGVTLAQPRDYGERATVANQCSTRLKMSMPLLVDEMDDRVGHAYSGMPARLYLIDRAGKVAYKGGRGPFGFKPEELEQALVLLLLDEHKPASESTAHVPILTNAEAWERLPPAEAGAGQPLPAWIRALAGSLPKTAAAMLQLDYVQRMESPLPPQLRAKLRWVAAHAGRCPYGLAYARADYARAGGRAEDLDSLPGRLEQLPEAERLALRLVQQLTEAAYTVTDADIARLVELYGEKQVVAMVLVASYANFQDRLFLALGIPLEPDGPLPPVKVRFRQPAPLAKKSEPGKDSPAPKAVEKPRRKLSPPAPNPPPVPSRLDDPEWAAFPFATLRERVQHQIAHRPGRVRIPDWETVRANLPDGVPRPEKPVRIIWSLVTLGYQPRLSAAWSAGLRAFRQECDLDAVFHESMFWVVTRSLQCFY
jgi:alkylhydroperoxidase family enzyme